MTPGEILFALVMLIVGVLIGVMANGHVNKRALSYEQYMACVRLVITQHTGTERYLLLEELEVYMDDLLSVPDGASAELQAIIKKVTGIGK